FGVVNALCCFAGHIGNRIIFVVSLRSLEFGPAKESGWAERGDCALIPPRTAMSHDYLVTELAFVKNLGVGQTQAAVGSGRRTGPW
ncbi:MAG: hypothetical protein ACYTEX_26375, partial [Planctomycetota bacterium]